MIHQIQIAKALAMDTAPSDERINRLKEHEPTALDKEAGALAHQKGERHLKKKRYKKALSEFDKAISLCPGDPASYRTRSQCYLHTGRPMEALKDGLTCVGLAPEWPKGHLCVGMALFKMDRPADAATAVQGGLDIDANDEQLKMLAEACGKRQKELDVTMRTGQIADWQKAQIEATSPHEKEQEGINRKNFGNDLFKGKEYKDAINQYSIAIACCPGNHTFYSNRSVAYFKMERFDMALSDGRKCIELKPDWLKGYFRTVAALCKLGKASEARLLLEQGIFICLQFSLYFSGQDG